MNTKLCPNCHKHIAVFNNECPICHTDLTNVPEEEIPYLEQPITENPIQDVNTAATMVMPTKKKRKKIVIISAVVLAIAVLITVVVINNHLSYNEEMAVIYARSIKNSLKSPNSLKFYSDIVYLEDKEYHDYYFFDYTAQNGYGAEVRGQRVYIDGDAYDLNKDYSLEEQIKILNAQQLLIGFQMFGGGGDIVDYKIISAKKISRKI